MSERPAHSNDPAAEAPPAAGVVALYGEPVAGLRVTPVPTPLAALFAEAHERVTGQAAGVVSDGRIEGVSNGVAVQLSPYEDDLTATLHTLAGARDPILLAGPGVLRGYGVAGVHALATAGSLGVVNTWGAKGIFDWRSRHHLATVGLQADDFVLGGLADADLIIAAGVDALEAPAERWQRLAPIMTVDPAHLGVLAERWTRPPTDIHLPELRRRLAAATHAGWAQTGAPLWPTATTLGYATALGPDGLIAADPGTAGFWVARTFATTSPRGAIVPSTPAAGAAVAAVAVARLHAPLRPALAVVDGDDDGCVDETVELVIEAAAALGVAVGLEVWSAAGEQLDPDAHRRRLTGLTSPAGGRATVATATDQLPLFLDAAGPIIAWT